MYPIPPPIPTTPNHMLQPPQQQQQEPSIEDIRKDLIKNHILQMNLRMQKHANFHMRPQQ